MRCFACRLAPLAVLLLVTGACTPGARSTRWASVRELTPAALANLAAHDGGVAAGAGGRLALTYVTRDSLGTDAWIAISSDSGAHFSAPVRLNARRGKVSSFAESPVTAAFGPSGQLVVAWASARDSGEMADDIVARPSADGGATFEPEVVLNDDHGLPSSTYHGFVTLDVTGEGRAIAAWLDGRGIPLAPGEHEPRLAAIWSAASEDGGHTWKPNVRVAGNVCPCCRPVLRAGASGIVTVAFRAVRDTVRDPAAAFSSDGGATFGPDTLLSADGWRLDGCPVDGPALTLARSGGLVAWTTGAGLPDGSGLVNVRAWSAGTGPTGPVRALADTALQPAHARLVSFGSTTLAGMLTSPEHGRRALSLKTLAPDGAESAWLHLGANVRSAALAGADSRNAYAAWIEQTDAGPRLRLARVTRE